MPTLDDVNLDALFCMFKGEPGTRKSTQALSFPTPQYWFSWDRKMKALTIPRKLWGIDPKQITYDDYTDWNGAKLKLEQLQANCPYKTVIADSITACADQTLRQTLRLKHGKKRQSGQDAGKEIAGIPVNEIEDYNAEAFALSELIALLKDIHTFHKVNVILIAHIIQVEYKSVTGSTHMSRTIVTAGKRIAAKIPAYCDEVYHFNIESSMVVGEGGSYGLLTEHTGDDFARTTLPLEHKISFGNDPLYDKYILPAIKKLKEEPPPTVKF